MYKRKGGNTIPTKTGKVTTVILFPEEEQIVRELTAKRYLETGKMSQSDTVRYLIREGIQAVKNKGV